MKSCWRAPWLGVCGRWLAVLAWALLGPGLRAQSSGEYDLKAVFLFNFAQFVQWPESAFPGGDASFVIGVLGDDPFGATLDAVVRGETVGGRPISVRRFENVEELGSSACQVLFVAQSHAARLGEVLARVSGRSVLTVGETAQFTDAGGIVQFLVVNNRVRLRINLDAARRARLAVSSKLLRVSDVVEAPDPR